MAGLPAFEMKFEPMAIEHLGLKLYSTLPPVISEFVSNAYDAESPKVEVVLPAGGVNDGSEVKIRDFGHGMSAEEVQDEFLPIARSRRGDDGRNVMSKNGKVRVTGRKGLGKLSCFGIAKEMDVRAIRNKQAVCIRLNYDEMRKWAKNNIGVPYRAAVVDQKTGRTDEADGVEITLRKFHRTRPISADVVRRGLARRLSFIGRNFQVLINGSPIRPGDRVSRDECPEGFSWNVDELPKKGRVGDGLQVRGWIGFVRESSQTERGIDIFASGKAVELGSYFNFPSTHVQFARAYLVGEIEADFLDAEEDLVATARNSVVWETEIGSYLEKWGQEILAWAFQEWVSLRKKKKEERVIVGSGFDVWLKKRSQREQRVAQKMVSLLVDDPAMDEEKAKPLLEIVKSSVETISFEELVNAIETEASSPGKLLQLFEEWRVIEARELLRLAHGRMEALNKLKKYIDQGALEVKEMEPLLAKNPWIIDASWSETNIEQHYTKLLKKHFKEPQDLPESDRRLDIWGVRASGAATVVELKRPEKTLSRKDLDQIEAYVDWLRSNIVGTGQDAPKYANGLLVIGKISSDQAISKKIERLAGSDIRVETYQDLYARAGEFYTEVDRRLEEVAPEYSQRKKAKGKDV